MSPSTASGSSSVIVASVTAFVNVAVKVAVSCPSLASIVIVCVPFRIFWNSAAVLAHSKVSWVPLVTLLRVFFTTPSSFSFTVTCSRRRRWGIPKAKRRSLAPQVYPAVAAGAGDGRGVFV